jgi:hypothetical protein
MVIISVGGFEWTVPDALELVEIRTFGSRAIFERYGRAR